MRPWCNAGLSMGAGGDIDGEIGGNFLRKSKKQSQKQLHGLPSFGWSLFFRFRGIADKGVHGLASGSTGRSCTKA